MARPSTDLDEFWPCYVSQHLNPTNRQLHFAGTTAGLACLGAAVATRRASWLPIGLGLGYGLAWIGHLVFEKNRPATLGEPLLSLRADMRMYRMMWEGRMDGEVRRLKPKLKSRRKTAPARLRPAAA